MIAHVLPDPTNALTNASMALAVAMQISYGRRKLICVASIPITIWQFSDGREWHFHHIEEGHVPREHQTITPLRFRRRGARLWRYQPAFINDRFEIVQPEFSTGVGEQLLD
jgi:hypothetical protein